jgi:hypothetical protein
MEKFILDANQRDGVVPLLPLKEIVATPAAGTQEQVSNANEGRR